MKLELRFADGSSAAVAVRSVLATCGELELLPEDAEEIVSLLGFLQREESADGVGDRRYALRRF